MNEDQRTYQRALSGAVLGLIAQVIVTVVLLLLALYTDSGAAAAATWHAGGGILIWLLLVVVYQQHKLERIEALETEQLSQRHGADSSIFETSADDLAIARRRLDRLVRWGLPSVGLFTALYLLGIGAWLSYDFRAVLAEPVGLPSGTPAWMFGFAIGTLAFGCFVISRYVAGMAKLEHWQLLRGGAGYLVGCFMTSAALAIGYMALHFEASGMLRYLALIVPLFMLVIGIEMSLNFLLDIYRPRKPGEIPRPAFDSRLLGLLTTPESIAKTINEAINYQFGFEVTQSWFWQLLSRVFGWLVILGAAVLVMMSSVLIVGEGEQALVTRFGRLTTAEPIDPGIHLKLPWPLSSAQYYDVKRIHTIRAGSDLDLMPNVPILWSNVHTEDTPVNLIVAPPALASTTANSQTDNAQNTSKTPAVSLVNAEIDVQYHIGNLMQYVMSNDEALPTAEALALADRDKSFHADRLLKAIAQTQASRWLYTYDIDALIGVARQHAGQELRQRIQKAADEAKLGVTIVQVNVKSVHPPAHSTGDQEEVTVADAFLATVSALHERQTAIENARKEQIKTLALVAGSVDQAQNIVTEINELRSLRAAQAPVDEIRQREAAIERTIREAGGKAAEILVAARAERWARENAARGEAAMFEKTLLAYRQAPRYYRTRAYLQALGEGMADARKYVLIGDRDNLVLRFDLKDQVTGFENLNLESDQ